jgi:hypothetical protein
MRILFILFILITLSLSANAQWHPPIPIDVNNTTFHVGNLSGPFLVNANDIAIWHNNTSLTDSNILNTNLALLSGRSGGQTLYGGTAASETLTLISTSHATKGCIIIGASGLRIWGTGNVSIGTTSSAGKFMVANIPIFANNAAAITAGLAAGVFHRSGGNPDSLYVVH